jgi:hypothetical protein
MQTFTILFERTIAWIAIGCVFALSAVAQDFSQHYSVAAPSDLPVASPFDSPDPGIKEYELDLPSSISMSRLRRIDGAPVEQPITEQVIADPRYRVYRVQESITSYMPGDGEQFGWLDFENTPYISRSNGSGITIGTGLHLLSGPNSVPLPPRLWDFVLGYQNRSTIGDRFSYDLASSIGVYSDFEDSAREGVRPLGHAVGSWHRSDLWDWVLGVDYLNRDDFKILPVMGCSWHNPSSSNWRLDLVFPRPRIGYSLSSSRRIYLCGLLGGGTWDIEMPRDTNDVMTYRDYRILFGHERLTPAGNTAATEIGIVFNRQLDMRHSLQQVEFDDAFIIRFVARR